jgi:hypothetical protein
MLIHRVRQIPALASGAPIQGDAIEGAHLRLAIRGWHAHGMFGACGVIVLILSSTAHISIATHRDFMGCITSTASSSSAASTSVTHALMRIGADLGVVALLTTSPAGSFSRSSALIVIFLPCHTEN